MQSCTYIDGDWHAGNPPLIGAMDHAAWLGSIVFDGARAFDGVTPDLDRHCERLVASARAMGLKSMLEPDAIMDIALDGVGKFPPGAALYIKPTLFATAGMHLLCPDPVSTRFALVLFEAPLPAPDGFSACVSSYRRPTVESAPTDAKASCLYPNGARAVMEAVAKGFDNAVLRDALGNVAEFATSNLFLVKDGVCVTPYPNGTFLNGVTRQRVIGLLRAEGVEVEERVVRVEDLAAADEIFSTGNYSKVMPLTRFEDRDLQPGPVFRRARELYWDFAHSRA